MSNEMRRGDIWWVEWPVGVGSEQFGRRPSLVIQEDRANELPTYPKTIITPISSKGLEVSFHVRLEPTRENGLSVLSYVKCENVWTVSKARLERRIGRVTPDEMRRVDAGLRRVLAL